MTPSQKARSGCHEARNPKWRLTVPPVPLKRPAATAQAWPTHFPHPAGNVHRCHIPSPLPHVPLFHTRHAEESAERPHLVTIIRPCVKNTLRKVTVLLNRRSVVSFDQLLLDISEALGFPRWHRARVTRLYTTHAREVKGICDFFRGDVAFLAFGKGHPELGSIEESLEELFPEHADYRAAALLAWERRFRTQPGKAPKTDSGYSEGTDSNGINPNKPQIESNTCVKNQRNSLSSLQADKNMSRANNTLKSVKKDSSAKVAHPPNHLQRLRARGWIKEREPSVLGPFKHEDIFWEADMPSPMLCDKCLSRRSKHHGAEVHSTLTGLAPLPPVSGKLKGRSSLKHDTKDSLPPRPISREQGKRLLQPSQDLVKVHQEQKFPIHPPLDSSDVTMSDIERCYQIGRVVGDGNFAVVRECHRRDNGQMLAIKIVERSKLIGREHMMQNELSLLGSLCHPRIVRLLAHHHTHTHSYLVMELVSGGDLFEAISQRGTFSEAAAGLMVSDVSEALDYIHCRSIVHRDLKPENLLIEQVSFDICRLKLADFGLAMVVSEPVFTICGTPTYVAPEILSETGYGIAVDVWALGVILFILLCGFAPFRSHDRDQEELFEIIKQAQFHFQSPYWDSITEEARSFVSALLQPDPTVRLTAKQTLLHPWVRAMASVCRQGELQDRSHWTSSNAGEKQKELRRTTEAQPAAESLGEKSSWHRKNAVIPKELNRHEKTDTNRDTRQKQKPSQLPVRENNKVTISQCTEATSHQHKNNSVSKKHKTTCPSMKSDTDCAHFKQLTTPATYTGVCGQTLTQLGQNREGMLPPVIESSIHPSQRDKQAGN